MLRSPSRAASHSLSESARALQANTRPAACSQPEVVSSDPVSRDTLDAFRLFAFWRLAGLILLPPPSDAAALVLSMRALSRARRTSKVPRPTLGGKR